MMSDDNDEDNDYNKDELGGMRIFPSHHAEIVKLVKEAGCHIVPVGLSDDTNIFYCEGKRVLKKDVILDEETKRSVKDAANLVRDEFFRANGGKTKLDPWNNDELRNSSLRELWMKYGATDKEFETYIHYRGYNLLDDDVTAALWIAEGELYGTQLDKEQAYVKEGYEKVIQNMAQKSKCKIIKNTKVYAVKTHPNGKSRVVEFTGPGGDDSFTAGAVVMALPKDSAEEILKSTDGVSQERNAVLDNVKIMPLFKCFMEWKREPGKKQWWKEKGFTEGKSTTDSDLRQLHYYDNEDLLIYNSGSFAVKWNEAFEQDPMAAKKKIFNLIKEMHDDEDIPEPDWDSTIWKFWPNGSHKWRKGVDVKKAINTYSVGNDKVVDDMTLYLCGDAFSTHQGWTMGCVETVNICFDAMKRRHVI
mmetsp:Transcript_9819/g.12752  ORF Transcript_9819/g.12752 Transcript_9819/m.12752 type:complete len:417 (+) Transcript_9819:3-1253(+)